MSTFSAINHRVLYVILVIIGSIKSQSVFDIDATGFYQLYHQNSFLQIVKIEFRCIMLFLIDLDLDTSNVVANIQNFPKEMCTLENVL